MVERKIGIINTTAPHGRANARESLDMSLALSAFNESISLFFIEDGIYQLLKDQNPSQILQKHFSPQLKMLNLYDVENIYVSNQALVDRSLTKSDLLIDVEILNIDELKQKLLIQDQLLSF